MSLLSPSLAGQQANSTLSGVVIYAIVGAPIGVITGIGIVAIGLTAWAVIVPLLFAGLKFPLFDSLFISAFLESVACLVSMAIYGFRLKVVQWKTALCLSPFVIVPVALSTVFLSAYLSKIKSIFRGSVSILSFITGAGFLVKGTLDCIRHHRRMKRKRAQQHREHDAMGEDGADERTTLLGPPSEEGIVQPMDASSGNAHKGATHSASPSSSSSSSSSSSHTSGRGPALPPPDPGAAAPEGLLARLQALTCCQTRTWGVLQDVLLVAVTACIACCSGMIAFGGGVFIAINLVVFRRMPLINATGTAVVLVLCTMGTYCVCLIALGRVHWGLIWPYLLIACGYQLVGTLVGACIALKVPRQGIFLLVAAVVLASGTFATVQTFFFTKK